MIHATTKYNLNIRKKLNNKLDVQNSCFNIHTDLGWRKENPACISFHAKSQQCKLFGWCFSIGLFAGIAAADGHDRRLCDAAAGHEMAAAAEELAGQEARVDLTAAAHTPPTHAIVVIVAAF